MYIERRRSVHIVAWVRRRKISAGKRTFIDSIIDLQSKGGKWGCIHTQTGKSSERSKAIWVKDVQHYREGINGRGGGGA